MIEPSAAATMLSLRGTRVQQLRELVTHFTETDTQTAQSLDRNQLIGLLSREINENVELRETVGKSPVSFKPSFYLMVLAPDTNNRLSQEKAISRLQRGFRDKDEEAAARPVIPSRKGFEVTELINHENEILEIHLTWQKIHWYWDPSEVTRSHIYELQYGLIILDFSWRKAIVACHTESVRDLIIDVVATAFDARLTPMVLTRPLLDQIGKFESVKRAAYFIEKPDAYTPANISYADDKLSSRYLARVEEDDSRSVRKQSYYVIPLASIEDQGVGATSDSGKLWITRETPLDSVREYAFALLRRVGSTLGSMSDRGEYSEVMSSLGIPSLPGMGGIKNASLRQEVYRLLESLVNMLLRGEEARAFSLTPTLLGEGVPKYLEYPRLQLTDPEADVIDYWSDAEGLSQLVRPHFHSGKLILVGHPSKEELDLRNLRHPITAIEIEVERPLEALHTGPTRNLHEILLEAIRHIATQVDGLASVSFLPFRIHGNQLLLDVNRAYGRTGPGAIQTQIYPEEIVEFRQAMQRSVSPSESSRLAEQAFKLGEKCAHMSDDNCQSCVDAAAYVCLRSLVARSLKNPLLLAHKGIELSDIQGTVHLRDESLALYGFAKRASSKKSGLTVRNKNGAVLLSQVLSQVEKTTFNTVAIIAPSTINEDLRQRLGMVCALFRKRLVFIDLPVLTKLLNHFEDQLTFDGLDAELMYKRSTPTG